MRSLWQVARGESSSTFTFYFLIKTRDASFIYESPPTPSLAALQGDSAAGVLRGTLKFLL